MRVPRPASHVTLVLKDSHGQQDGVDVHGPGGTIRVVVGRPGHRSIVWRAWANQNKSDVFVAARVLAGTQKFSLHESGDWRNQWVTKEKAQRFTSQENRVLDQWPRPPAGLRGAYGAPRATHDEQVVLVTNPPLDLASRPWTGRVVEDRRPRSQQPGSRRAQSGDPWGLGLRLRWTPPRG
jgi:hypothetical protein